MFTRKKLIAIMLCAIFSCGLFCSSYLTSNAEAKPINPDTDIILADVDIVDDDDNGNNNQDNGDDTNNTDNTDAVVPPSPNNNTNDTTTDYIHQIKSYRNGYTAYNGAVKYLQKLNSYQINSTGYLNCTLLGQSLDGSITFKTVKSGEDFYNLFGINTSMFNVNIQTKSNTKKIVHRYNQRASYTNGYRNWVSSDFSEVFQMFNRYIVAGDINTDSAVISGFRKTSTGYKFIATLNYSDLLENISKMVKTVGGTNIGLTFKTATIEFVLDQYGAPVSAKYQYTGKATYLGFTAPASVTLIEKYGNFNKNIKIDTEIFGKAPA